MKAKWITPAVTPLHEDGSLDFTSAGKLYDDLMEAGIDGVLIGGSIGEFFSLTLQQRTEAARFAVEHIAGRMQVIVGTANMISDDIVTLSNTCLEAGADAVMIVPPYYFTFGDDEMYAFYSRMAREIRGRVYLYNFPDRTGYSISPAVVRRLAADYPNLVGIKDTISGLDHTRELIKAVKPIRPDFEIFSGFDDNFAHNVLSGGDGCIAGISNVAPKLCAGWVRAMRDDDLARSASYQQKINRCMDLYAIGSPFVPYVKEASRQMGHIASSAATFPMPAADSDMQKKVHEFLLREELITE